MALRNAFDALATETTASSINTKVPALVSGRVPVVLPTGFASDTLQTTGNDALAAIVARNADVTATGTLSALNANPLTGVATANSAVELDLQGRDTVSIHVQPGTTTGAISVQVTVNGTNWITLAGANSLLNLGTGAYSATIPQATTGIYQVGVGSVTKVRVSTLAATTGAATVTLRAVDGNGLVALDSALPAGSAVIGSVTQNGTWSVTATPFVATVHTLETAGSANATLVKGSAGTVYYLWASNPQATVAYIHLYNASTAPTAGSGNPIRTIPIPGTSDVSIPFGELGHRFATGIGYTVTGGPLKSDSSFSPAGIQIGIDYI